MLHAEGLDAYVVRRLGLPFRDVDWKEWEQLLRRVHRPAKEVTIALVGKYIDLPDAYLSVTEALRAGGFANDARVNIRWVKSDDCETPEGAARELDGVDGVLVPGGFGVRGIEGKIGAIRHARENKIPLLGICLGMQCMVIEAARNLAGIEDANSTEFDPDTTHPVISTMADQEDVVAGERDMGGTMRLGLYPAKLAEGTLARQLYGGKAKVDERHRHRYEVNNSYREQLEKVGMVFSGLSPDGRLVEYAELPADVHPFFIGTQAHPEFRSRPTRAQPAVQGPDRRRPRLRRQPRDVAQGRAGQVSGAEDGRRRPASGDGSVDVPRRGRSSPPRSGSAAGHHAVHRRGRMPEGRGRRPRLRRPSRLRGRGRARRRRTGCC